jgi:hypothetical protein
MPPGADGVRLPAGCGPGLSVTTRANITDVIGGVLIDPRVSVVCVDERRHRPLVVVVPGSIARSELILNT